MSVIFYGCVSLDGYLADKNHGLGWLHASGSPEETEYDAFYKTIDIVVMGRRTFDEVSKLGSVADIYPTTTNYVFTSRNDLEAEGIQTVSGDVVTFIQKIAADKRIWLVGGGGLLAPLLEAQLVDRMYIQVAPVILGDGIPLFQKQPYSRRFVMSDVKRYGQFAELVYDRLPANT